MRSDLTSTMVRRLRTRIWLHYCISSLGCSVTEFERDYLGVPGEPGPTSVRWSSGGRTVSPGTVHRVAARYLNNLRESHPSARWTERRSTVPITEAHANLELVDFESTYARVLGPYRSLSLFNLPLWKLLDIKHLDSKELGAICRAHLTEFSGETKWHSPTDHVCVDVRGGFCWDRKFRRLHPTAPWTFPKYGDSVISYELHPVDPWHDTQKLCERGDLFGFQGVLAAMRFAWILGDDQQLLNHSRNAYPALVGLCRTEPFVSYWGDFALALHTLQLSLGVDQIAPDMSLIRQRVLSTDYLPNPTIFSYSSKTNSSLGEQGVARSVSRVVSPN